MLVRRHTGTSQVSHLGRGDRGGSQPLWGPLPTQPHFPNGIGVQLPSWEEHRTPKVGDCQGEVGAGEAVGSPQAHFQHLPPSFHRRWGQCGGPG